MFYYVDRVGQFIETAKEMLDILSNVGSWQGISSVYALSSIAKLPIGTFWPVVTHPVPHSYTRTVVGRAVSEELQPQHFMMFTSTRLEEQFTFNHFVPLVEREVRAFFFNDQ